MFESAIEKVLQYTRPLHSISRTYGGLLQPGSATFFFVNDKGVAITCKHVMQAILSADQINHQYAQFRQEKNRLARDGMYTSNLQTLELKYRYQPETIIQLKHNFLNCFDRIEQIVSHVHPTLDLAIVEFKGFNKILYNSFARFAGKNFKIRQGKMLCRIGFPFPEFNNFQYNGNNDDIEWTNTGNPNSPSFPIDGIVTRFLGDVSGGINGIEMSTPGLRGQSGGPLFDNEGVVYGMQYATNHLHLGFDIKDREIMNDGKKSKVSNFPFLHTGLCVHVEKITAFLREHRIEFHEADVD